MLDWFRGKKITINIYGEKQDITLPNGFKEFVKVISNQLQIHPNDCTNNLVFKYNENKIPRFFTNENEYNIFLNYIKNSKKKETVFIEFNEKTAEIIRQSLAFNEKNNKVEIKDTNLSLLIKKSMKKDKTNKKTEPIKEESKKEAPKKKEIKKEEPKKEEVKNELPKILENTGMEEKIIETITPIEIIEEKKEPTAAELLGFEELDIDELNEENNFKESNDDIIISPEKEQEIKSVWNIFSLVNKIPGVGGFFKKKEENESNENKEEIQTE